MSSSSPKVPTRTQALLTDRLDSRRWDYYLPRIGDVIVATYPKCGTTWTEMIVLNLIHQGDEKPLLHDVAPWIERRTKHGGGSDDTEVPIQEVIGIMKAQSHQRQIKTHLPLACLPFWPEARYLVVGRDTRDACMSFYNHRLNRIGGTQLEMDISAFWQDFISQVEDEGRHPHLSYYDQWWSYRNLENVLLVHFNDLKRDLRGEIDRIAGFIDVATTNDLLDTVVHATTFSTMKDKAKELLPGMTGFKDGASTFINKGTNGRWQVGLAEEDERNT